MARSAQHSRDEPMTAFIDDEPHDGRAPVLGSHQAFVRDEVRRPRERGLDVFDRNSGVRVGDLGERKSGRYVAEDMLDGQPGALDHRLPDHDGRIALYAWVIHGLPLS
jgi:hypothetical protein